MVFTASPVHPVIPRRALVRLHEGSKGFVPHHRPSAQTCGVLTVQLHNQHKPVICGEWMHVPCGAWPATRHALTRSLRRSRRPASPRSPGSGLLVAPFVEADLSVAATASAMSLHPNSLRYRLGRITELTGRDPRK